MGQIDNSSADMTTDTVELAWELQQPRPDRMRIQWLINDMQADVAGAMRLAHLEIKDVIKNPALKPLQLHKHIHG
jgi:hypothetical protein